MRRDLGRGLSTLAWLALSGCAGAAGGPSAPSDEVYPNAPAPPLPADLATTTWQRLGVPAASVGPEVIATPSAWLALSQRSVGDARAPSAWESHLFRSVDGIHWQRVQVSPRNDDLWLRGIAAGGGTIVLAGHRFGSGDGGVIFTSPDGLTWREAAVEVGNPTGLRRAVYTGGRFFALSNFRNLLTSKDARSWTRVDLRTTVMPEDVAFGEGRYLVVGSGEPQWSSDGVAWQPAPLPCALPGACIQDPSGVTAQGLHSQAVYAEGTFYIDQASSSDGRTWQALPGLVAAAYVDGVLLGHDFSSGALIYWRPGQAAAALNTSSSSPAFASDGAGRLRWNGAARPEEYDPASFPEGPLPDSLEFPLPGGQDCRSSRCVLVGNELYLVTGDASAP